ncbi:hypothetical protein [Catenuloplanes japonicus]|uniref:hypothetical protein n=1 Tax=Catenuloplanes japonicus TaxID=33876 RepID=UPI0005272F71|nr:hypothetical protein [Catenuloplanes japonicus]
MIDRTGRWIGLIGAVLCIAWALAGLNLPGLIIGTDDPVPVDQLDYYIRDGASGTGAVILAIGAEKGSSLLALVFLAAFTLGVRSGWGRVIGTLWLGLFAVIAVSEGTDAQSSSYIAKYVGHADEITTTFFVVAGLITLSALALACGLGLIHDGLIVLLMLGTAGLHLAMIDQAPPLLEKTARFTWEAWVPAWMLLGAAAFGIAAAIGSFRLRRGPASPRVWTAAALVRGLSGTPAGLGPGFETYPRLGIMLAAGVAGTLMIVGALVAGYATPPPVSASVPAPETTR